MDEERRKIVEKIKNNPLGTFTRSGDIRPIHEIKRDADRERRKDNVKKVFKGLAYIFLGIGSKEDIAKNNTHYTNQRPNDIPRNSSKDFRNSMSMEDYYWERQRLEDYWSAIDGRGDHDCNCDHDER